MADGKEMNMRKIVKYFDEKFKLWSWSNIRTRRTITPGNTDNGCLELSNYLTKSSPSLTDFLLMTSGFEKEKKKWFRAELLYPIYQEQLCMESTFLCPFKNWGLGQGSGWKRGTDFYELKWDIAIFCPAIILLKFEKLLPRWSSPWTKSSWSNETKAPGITLGCVLTV